MSNDTTLPRYPVGLRYFDPEHPNHPGHRPEGVAYVAHRPEGGAVPSLAYEVVTTWGTLALLRLRRDGGRPRYLYSLTHLPSGYGFGHPRTRAEGVEKLRSVVAALRAANAPHSTLGEGWGWGQVPEDGWDDPEYAALGHALGYSRAACERVRAEHREVDGARAVLARYGLDPAEVGVPTEGDVRAWTFDGACDALDGCSVEPDGKCEHGYPAWLRALGLV